MENCSVCKKQINVGAKTCEHCGSSTNRAYRFIGLWGQIVGYVVVITSAAAYLAGQVLNYVEYLTTQNEAQIVALNSRYVSVANVGGNSLFVTGIEHLIDLPKISLPTGTSVQKSINIGEVVTKEFDAPFQSGFWTKIKSQEGQTELLANSNPEHNNCIYREFRLSLIHI